MSDKEDTPLTDTGFDSDARKRKSKSPSTFASSESKRVKSELDDLDSDDIAKQYKRFINSPKFNLNSEELFCICRKPDHGSLMISCDGCEEWFHTKCMKIDNQHLGLLDRFYCKFCHWKGKGVTRWNRKCRRPLCWKAARTKEESKYCSDECGKSFLRLKLTGSLHFSKEDINFVIHYCDTHANLEQLGLKFPELEVVANQDLDKLPPLVKDSIEENDLQQTKLRAEIDILLKKRDYVLLVKKRNETINEMLTELVGENQETEKSKKGKKKLTRPKKIDLCCFDKNVSKDIDDPKSVPDLAGAASQANPSVYNLFKEEIDGVLLAYQAEDHSNNSICLQDRRKCLRHNGWYSLLQDKTWKKLNELKASLETLKLARENALREYSISIYEQDENTQERPTPELLAQPI